MKLIAYGSLPTRSFFHAVVTGSMLAPQEHAIYGLLQRSLRKSGPNGLLHELLNACGFEWSAPPGCSCGYRPGCFGLCICIDVVAVAEALGEEVPS